MAGAHIILISSGNGNLLTDPEMGRMRRLVSENNAKLSSILVPSSSPDSFYEELSLGSQGLSYQLSDTGHPVDFLFQLNRAFSGILRAESVHPTESPELVHRAEFYSSDGDTSSGQFVIDPTLGRDTLFGIYVKDEEDHLIRAVEFTADPSR